jgi:hypothetical protein
MMTVTELLSRAKHAIESGETSLHVAAEDIAAAQEQGATQREIAEAVGKSAAWVNRLLKWRQSGYQDGTAFGPQAKASRQRAQHVQATEQKKRKPATTSEQAQAAAARARAETAKAEAAKAKADAQKAKADAARAKAEARAAKARARAKQYAFFSQPIGADGRQFDSRQRDRLVKLLGMLGSEHEGAAARHRVAIIRVTHFTKAKSAALLRVTGSFAFVATARSAFTVTRKQDDPDLRVLAPLKNNLAADCNPIAFRIKQRSTTDNILAPYVAFISPQN